MSYYIINQMLNVITKKKAGKDTYNKKTLTGPTNCKKTTRHHGHLTLCAKSRKTNDAKSKNGQKPQFGQFFLTISRSNIFKLQFFLKNSFQSK